MTNGPLANGISAPNSSPRPSRLLGGIFMSKSGKRSLSPLAGSSCVASWSVVASKKRAGNPTPRLFLESRIRTRILRLYKISRGSVIYRNNDMESCYGEMLISFGRVRGGTEDHCIACFWQYSNKVGVFRL